MDVQTLTAYNTGAADYAKDWLEQPSPQDLYELLSKYFKQGSTADIGCGAGRDTAWLNVNGFPAIGYDSSEGLLNEARLKYPKIIFKQSALPELANIADNRFQNVLCETVIMHLDPEVITSSVKRLMDILNPRGTLYLSWRVTKDVSLRDAAGRLYAAFDKQLVLYGLGKNDSIMYDLEEKSVSSGKIIHRMIVEKE